MLVMGIPQPTRPQPSPATNLPGTGPGRRPRTGLDRGRPGNGGTDRLLQDLLGGGLGGGSSTGTMSRATSDSSMIFSGELNSVMRAVPPTSRGSVDSPWYRDNQITPVQDALRTHDQMMNEFWKMGRKRQRKLAQKLWLAGLVSGATYGLQDANMDDVVNAYGKLLDLAADRYAAGHIVTPTQLLNQMIEFRLGGDMPKGMSSSDLYNSITSGTGGLTGTGSTGSGGGGGKKLGPITTKTVSRVMDLTSPEEAKAFLKVAMTELLGREPSREEYEDYIAMLNAKEEEDEVVTRTRSTTYPSGRARSRTTVRQDGELLSRSSIRVDKKGNEVTRERTFDDGSFTDPAAMAERIARRKPNYAEYQAVSTYLPALMELLGPIA